MKSPPESVTGQLLLKTGESVFVPSKNLRNSPDGRTWGTEVPYLHFRKSPVKGGLYVVSDIWMHSKATDPNVPSSYCYTLVRVRDDRTWTKGWRGELRLRTSFTPEDISGTKLPYNCLDWDQLLRDQVVTSYAYTPGEKFDMDEFRKDLGQVLYKHKVTLSVDTKFSDDWDDYGTDHLVVLANGEVKGDLGHDFPKRRSAPAWDSGKRNR
jgi:hypothetical protein